jgi:hypothetical protein
MYGVSHVDVSNLLNSNALGQPMRVNILTLGHTVLV